jgi:quercetin dioxygenase-like cupin family protein
MTKTLWTWLALPMFAAATVSTAHGREGAHETTTRKFEMSLPNVPGKSLLAVEVDYPPGAATPSHTHEQSAFIFAYVLSGEVESAVDNEAPRVYKAGESWHELPGARHRVSRNASKTRPAKLLAVFVADEGVARLTFPDPDAR